MSLRPPAADADDDEPLGLGAAASSARGDGGTCALAEEGSRGDAPADDGAARLPAAAADKKSLSFSKPIAA